MAIEIISASAGSGKTYRLATILENAVREGGVRPEAVLATTFTRTAAAELIERVRTRLLSAGFVEQAQRLSAARIGTVNSVCSRLVTEFALPLGLSPRLQTLDEPMSEAILNQALSLAMSGPETDSLAELRTRMISFDWTDAIKRVVSLARTNAVSPVRLAECARHSADGLLELLGPVGDGALIEQRLLAELQQFVDGVRTVRDPVKQTVGALRMARRGIRRLQSGMGINWAGYQTLSLFPTGERVERLAQPVREAAAAHCAHPLLHDDLRRATELVFDLAGRALTSYQEYKQQRGVIDFEDQEAFTLQLLDRPDVQQLLADTLDLVLVDEFQDTTPIQLAIFLKLSRIAKRSVWVGDQKQAIYGFRGSDPALMDATIEEILGQREPSTLDTSWRSRPGLVELTSALFSSAFGRHGVPKGRVLLTPAVVEPEPPLGPIVEYWEIYPKKFNSIASAMASAVGKLLDDPQALVRDRQNGNSRRALPGDIAILCRYNWSCVEVARALDRAGIPVVLARSGLLESVEARLAVAGLRLWVDARDTLALAEISRLLGPLSDGDSWLNAFAADPKREGIRAQPPLAELLQMRENHPGAGVVTALEHVFDVLELYRWCHQVGATEQRLANLDALRAHAVTYVKRLSEQGGGSSIAGFCAYLEGLAATKSDEQGLVAVERAVTVCTWHKSKGLEWPICVLLQLDRPARVDALGVQIVGDLEQIDLDDPLRGLWIRYWPSPYHEKTKSSPLHRSLVEHPATLEIQRREERQLLRLLYVGWTRARDRVVLAGNAEIFFDGMLPLICDQEGRKLIRRPFGEVNWAGVPVDLKLRQAGVPDLDEAEPVAWPMVALPGPRSYPPANLPPSSANRFGKAGPPITIGEPIRPRSAVEMNHLGEAVHGFLAADRAADPTDDREMLAYGLLLRWKLGAALIPADLLEFSDRLSHWIAQRFSGARRRVEWPIKHRLGEGTLVSGTADLVLELPDRLILLDHKCYPGTLESAIEKARSFAGQLDLYAAALTEATGKAVSERWIHLPLIGIVVPIEPHLESESRQLTLF